METADHGIVTTRHLPCYRSHKNVWALKIAAIVTDKYPVFSGLICKGSIALGSACGRCERCEYERANGPIRPGATITPAEDYPAFHVTADYMEKHKPQVGGYWVQYVDGYQSFSPAKAFEEGYTRVSTRVQE